MTNEHGNLEENLGRLIRASYGPEVRPSRQLGEDVLRRMASRLAERDAARRREASFPEPVLGVLLGAVLLMGVWSLAAAGLAVPTTLPEAAMAAVLLLNLAFVPIACITIVLRRRYAQPS